LVVFVLRSGMHRFRDGIAFVYLVAGFLMTLSLGIALYGFLSMLR